MSSIFWLYWKAYTQFNLKVPTQVKKLNSEEVSFFGCQ